MNKKNVNLLKIIIGILAIVALVGITIYLIPIMKDISTTEGQIQFKEELKNSGIFGMLTLFGLQLAQIFLIILPGEPIEVLAGMCYGAFGGYIFITLSVFIITTAIFFMVRKLGRKFVYEFYDKEKVKKIEKSKLFKNPKKIEWIMIILFMIPGAPKDIVIYIAGLLPIKPLRFILISTFARFPSVISSTLAGANLIEGDWKISIIVYASTFAIVGIFAFIINKFDKSKTAEKVLKEIK